MTLDPINLGLAAAAVSAGFFVVREAALILSSWLVANINTARLKKAHAQMEKSGKPVPRPSDVRPGQYN